jgi:hypothetical protein
LIAQTIKQTVFIAFLVIDLIHNLPTKGNKRRCQAFLELNIQFTKGKVPTGRRPGSSACRRGMVHSAK